METAVKTEIGFYDFKIDEQGFTAANFYDEGEEQVRYQIIEIYYDGSTGNRYVTFVDGEGEERTITQYEAGSYKNERVYGTVV